MVASGMDVQITTCARDQERSSGLPNFPKMSFEITGKRSRSRNLAGRLFDYGNTRYLLILLMASARSRWPLDTRITILALIGASSRLLLWKATWKNEISLICEIYRSKEQLSRSDQLKNGRFAVT